MQETWIPSLGWGRSLGEGIGTPLQYCCLGNSMDTGVWCVAVHGVAKSLTRLSEFHFSWLKYTPPKNKIGFSSSLT